MKLLAPLVAILLLLTACASTSNAKPDTQRLPHVTLQSLGGGKAVDLSALRGPMVVNLWASWCGPCRAELPHYQAFAQKYAGKVGVLGVDWQETRIAKARALARQTGVTYPLVADPGGRLRVRFLPQVILVDQDGKIAYEQYLQIKSLAQIEKLVKEHLKVPVA
jgi:cytochrome c biogenesis protein CcmG/thiol:disulfide interchange protein DsbE